MKKKVILILGILLILFLIVLVWLVLKENKYTIPLAKNYNKNADEIDLVQENLFAENIVETVKNNEVNNNVINEISSSKVEKDINNIQDVKEKNTQKRKAESDSNKVTTAKTNKPQTINNTKGETKKEVETKEEIKTNATENTKNEKEEKTKDTLTETKKDTVTKVPAGEKAENKNLANTHFVKYNAEKTKHAVEYINERMKQDELFEELGGKAIAVNTKPTQNWFSYPSDIKLNGLCMAGPTVKVYVEDEYSYNSKGTKYYLYDTKAYILQTF